MKISIIAFDDFTDIDVFFMWDLLNRVKLPDWQVKLLGEETHHTSVSGLTIPVHGRLEEANEADAVLFASGLGTRKKMNDEKFLGAFKLNSDKQLIGSMCSGALILAALGLLDGKRATTYPTVKKVLEGFGIEVIEKPFVMEGNVATAAGCLAAQQLAGWVIERLVNAEMKAIVLQSIMPVGEGLYFGDEELVAQAYGEQNTISGAIAKEFMQVTDSRPALAQEVPSRDLLSLVSQVGIALLPRTSLEDTLKLTIDLVFESIPAERGFLFLKEGEELICKIARGNSQDVTSPNSQVQISRSITNKVLTEAMPILTSDAMHDPRFQAQHSVMLSQIRSVMAVPLASGEETFGMIYVDNAYNNRFKEEDLKVLTTIASVASIKIEHERLLEERLEKRRMEEELKVASDAKAPATQMP